MKLFFYLLIFIIPVQANSQASSDIHERKWKAGVFVGLFQPDIVLSKKENLNNIDEPIGFTFGSLVEANLTKSFSVTAKAGMSFDGTMMRCVGGCVYLDYMVIPVSLDLNLDINYKLPLGYNPYILAGFGYKNPLDSENKNATRSNTGIDLGAGFNKFFKRFTINPEVRYFWGITNISPLAPKESMYYHSIALVINIKG